MASTRRDFLRSLAIAGLAARRLAAGEAPPPHRRPPNLILFFTDDQGYNDVGCFGSPLIRTPNLDRMASEGMRFTSFYAQAVCGPSRAALMTGCYPIRVAEPGSRKQQHTVPHPRETTIAEVLKQAGYATTCVGKWHLAGGRKKAYDPQLMPNAQGFDSFFGTPLHNGYTRTVNPRSFRTQLMRDGEMLDDFLDQGEMDTLTQRYTREAIAFIRQHREQPFFLYLAHNMPHVPLGASKDFRGRSKRGLYGDVVEELDWSLGQILATLGELGLDRDTLLLFTSDNGPWVEKHIGDYGGSAHPLRGSKMMTWDGGLRVPCIARWPGRVPAGSECREIATTMDILPTMAHLAGAPLPEDRVLDGRDITPLLAARPGAASPHEAFFFYCFTHLQAVRTGRWKLVLPRPARPPWTGWSARMVDAVPETQLFDLEADVAEQHNVAGRHPDVVGRLMKLVEKARDELGDHDRIGKGARFFDQPAPTTADERDGRRRPKPPAAAAYDQARPVGNLRFTFEKGDLEGWRVVEGRLPGAASQVQPFYLRGATNKQGKGLLNTLGRGAKGEGSDALTGVLESPVFELRGGRMTFLVGGGAHADTRVALCDVATGKELMKASGTNAPSLRRVVWDVARLRGRKLFLRITDRSTGPWGHVIFDDFSTEGTIDAEATARRWRGEAR